MSQRDKEGFPFLNSAAETLAGVLPLKTVTRDEENYDTLRAVYLILEEALVALYNDFNAFKLPENVPKTTAIFDLMKQIESKQMAYNILSPTFEAVKTAMASIDSKYKEN